MAGSLVRVIASLHADRLLKNEPWKLGAASSRPLVNGSRCSVCWIEVPWGRLERIKEWRGRMSRAVYGRVHVQRAGAMAATRAEGGKRKREIWGQKERKKVESLSEHGPRSLCQAGSHPTVRLSVGVSNLQSFSLLLHQCQQHNNATTEQNNNISLKHAKRP